VSTGFTYTIGLKVAQSTTVGRATAAVDKLDTAVDRVHHSTKQARDATGRFTSKAERGVGKVTSAFNQARDASGRFVSKAERGANQVAGSMMRLAAQVGAVKFAYDSLRTAADLESTTTSLDFATAGQGAENVKFLRQTTDSLSVSMRSSLPAFQKWMGAVRGTSLEGQQARDVFYSVAEAGRVVGMSAEETEGAFLALSQMASKGKVSAEELRGQLGERLPGALAIASRSMNMTQGEFNKMLDSGKIMSEDFLPRFAQQLHKEFGGGVEAALGTANARFAAMDNAVLRLQENLGQKLMPTAIKLVDKVLIPAAEWLARNAEIIPMVAGAAIGGAIAMKAYGIATAFAAATGGFFTKVMTALNLTISLNPIGATVMAIGALVAAMTVAWKTSEEWRGYLNGIWETLKSVGSAVFQFLISPFKTAATLIEAALSFDLQKIKAAFIESGKAAKEAYSGMLPSNLGRTVYEGYKRGQAKGRASFRQDQEASKVARAAAKPDSLSATFGDTQTGSAADADAGGTGAKSDEQLRKGMSSITGGGARQRNYNISIGKLVETITLHTQKASDGIDDLADQVLAKLVQVINTTQQLQ
jgi:tape measure domain-containing protein